MLHAILYYDHYTKLFLQLFEVPVPSPLPCFELFVTPDEEYPHVCVGVTAG